MELTTQDPGFRSFIRASAIAFSIAFSGATYGSAPPTSLPSAGVYINGMESPLLPLLANATGTIDIEIYTMKSQTVRDLIRRALRRGVRVRIIMEPKPEGEKCDVFGNDPINESEAANCADLRSLAKDVRASGGVFQAYNKQNLCPNGGGADGTSCYQHGKIVLADGISLISTGNFDATSLCIVQEDPKECHRDYTLVDTNPMVFSTLTNIFEADLLGQKYDMKAMIPTSLRDYLTVSPGSLEPIKNFISSARISVAIEDQYLKDPDLNAAIIGAAKRGVRVSLTIASACAFGKPTPSEVTEITNIYSSFDQAGIETRMFNASNLINGRPGYMHAKAIVVDDNKVWIGSENGSTTSLTENREFGVVLQGSEYVSPIATTVAADHRSPNSETWQESLVCAHDR